MSPRRIVAIIVWALSWALAAGAVLLVWIADLPSEPLPGVFLSQAPAAVRASFDDIGVAVAVIYGPVSALILARSPHPVGVILAVHAVGSGLATFGVQWGLLGAQTPGLPLWGMLAFAAGWGFVPGTFMTATLPLLLTRRRPPTWQRTLVALCAIAAVVAWFISFTQQSVASPVNPFAIPSAPYQALLPGLYTALSFVAVGFSLVSCGVLVVRWFSATERSRTAWAWLTVGHAFLTLSYLSLVLPAGLALPEWVVQFGLIAPVIGQVIYPAAILVVILGQRLWGVELLVSRIVLWSLLTIGGILVYLLVVVLLPPAVPGADGTWIVAPLAVAVAAQPLRVWLQRRTDRLIYGDAADPSSLIARLGERIGELEPGAAGLRELATALVHVLRLGAVEIRSAHSPLEAWAGDSRTDPHAIPLTSRGRAVGELVVRARQGQRLDRRTISALDDIAGVVATAVQLVEGHVVLERARTALISLRAEERRAMRRELHDGLGPALAGIGFGLAAVGNLAETRPDRAAVLLGELSADLQRHARDVRELAHDVTPSVREGATLSESIQALARRFDSPGLQVTARVVLDRVPPDAVQDAAFHIAAEALANAVRHSRGRHIDISISLGETGLLVVRVEDDGMGMPPTPTPGIGLFSMRERAHRAHGDLTVTSSGNGTIVTARLPDTTA